jgi:hypothetical protein
MTKNDFTTETDPGGDVLKLVYSTILQWKQPNKTAPSVKPLAGITDRAAGQSAVRLEPARSNYIPGGQR